MSARPMYWSIKRELWENRSIWLVPLIVESVFLFGFLISTIMLPKRMSKILALEPAKQREMIDMPFSAAAGLVMLTAFIVGFFYCLDALNSERRDRSILFWKSLPVSDRTAVLAKASIPLVVLPLFLYTIILITQSVMLFASAVALSGYSKALTALLIHVHFFQSAIALIYGLIIIALWHAPLYAWLLLVSGWARRAAVLWALVPAVAISVFEKVAFNTQYFGKLMGYRMIGWFQRGFDLPPHGTPTMREPLELITPWRFFTTPGLWIGLLFAAAFLAAAVRMRRNRGPI